MSNTIRRTLLIGAGLGQLACGDGTSPRSDPRDLELFIPGIERLTATSLVEEEPSPVAGEPSPGEIPPEFQQAPTIIDYRTDASFLSSHAWAQGHMRYYGTHARQEVNLALRGVALPPVMSRGGDSDLYPAERALSTSASIVLDRSCGYATQAWTNHSAWHQFPVLGRWLRWGDTERGSQDGASQPACDTNAGDGGGGGGGTIVQVCYCMDYYSPSTGQWVHGGVIYCAEA